MYIYTYVYVYIYTYVYIYMYIPSGNFTRDQLGHGIHQFTWNSPIHRRDQSVTVRSKDVNFASAIGPAWIEPFCSGFHVDRWCRQYKYGPTFAAGPLVSDLTQPPGQYLVT